MVSEQRIALQFDRQLNQGLVRSAAAWESGLSYDEFEERLQVGRVRLGVVCRFHARSPGRAARHASKGHASRLPACAQLDEAS